MGSIDSLKLSYDCMFLADIGLTTALEHTAVLGHTGKPGHKLDYWKTNIFSAHGYGITFWIKHGVYRRNIKLILLLPV